MGYRIFSEALNRSNEPGFGSITMSILSILIMGTFLAQFIVDVGAAVLIRMSREQSESESSSSLVDEDFYSP